MSIHAILLILWYLRIFTEGGGNEWYYQYCNITKRTEVKGEIDLFTNTFRFWTYMRHFDPAVLIN